MGIDGFEIMFNIRVKYLVDTQLLVKGGWDWALVVSAAGKNRWTFWKSTSDLGFFLNKLSTEYLITYKKKLLRGCDRSQEFGQKRVTITSLRFGMAHAIIMYDDWPLRNTGEKTATFENQHVPPIFLFIIWNYIIFLQNKFRTFVVDTNLWFYLSNSKMFPISVYRQNYDNIHPF